MRSAIVRTDESRVEIELSDLVKFRPEALGWHFRYPQPIVGAFAAGLVLDEAHYASFHSRREKNLEELIRPVSDLLVPLFFVLMGLKVDLRAFGRLELLGFAI